LPANTKHPAIKGNFPGNPAVLCFQSQKDHSLVFADFRRLAAKKALPPPEIRFFVFMVIFTWHFEYLLILFVLL